MAGGEELTGVTEGRVFLTSAALEALGVGCRVLVAVSRSRDDVTGTSAFATEGEGTGSSCFPCSWGAFVTGVVDGSSAGCFSFGRSSCLLAAAAVGVAGCSVARSGVGAAEVAAVH